ncbi:hypothetical protein [Mycobacterium sp. E740]|uniref:hypothetical protein n=1 Tax=Mycobacterium sp. E740 TaxID=1834149 RepID=UPI0007FC9C07|nr:hypothetical protein [Mycobacterium sp. E740]OBI74861.1 hypothetical protein A5663_00455 [Mycobacterium sp. E740]
MEPVEINAGAWYLRALRDDELMDDLPALADMGETDPTYVSRCRTDWASDIRYTWAVCEPTTGEMLAEATLAPATGSIGLRARPGHAEAAQAAGDVVRRFAATL